MMQDIINICRDNPQIPVFLAVAIGYFIGKIKIYGFSLGSTAGVLIAALALGQMNVQITPLLKTVAFALFIFTIGYKVGPQFFGSLKKEAVHYILIAVVVAVAGLAIALTLGKIFGFDKGTTAGMLAGAMTQTSVIGTADGAIKHLGVSAAQKSTLESNVAVAYAITYIFGVTGMIVFYKLLPKILRINLKAEASKLQEEMSGHVTDEENPELFSWQQQLSLRLYKVTSDDAINKTVREVEALFSSRVAIDKIKRAEKVFKTTQETVIERDDVVALIAVKERLLEASSLIGPEIDDKEMSDITGEILDICVLNKDAADKSLGELSKKYGHGCFLRSITRQGTEIPITKDTVLHRCDVLRIAGAKDDVEDLVKILGYPERPTVTTDLIMVGIGCVLGTLVGLIMVPIFGIPLTLGVGGGVLVSGLVFGWLRSVHPTFGQIPRGAQWIFTDMGLNLFIACVGLIAGPRAIHALKTTGGALFFAGIIMTLGPQIVGMIFGRLILKMNHVFLFGALTGAGTATPALNALKDECGSSMPALGYAVPYAFANVILTIWGTVIINVM